MIKKNLPMLIITSIVIIIPIFIGLLLWNSLPDQIAIHWNANGDADNYAGKLFAVFVMPLFILGIHWICTLITFADPKKENIIGKPLTLVLWICPMISLLVGTLIYVTALGCSVDIAVIIPLVIGVLFVIIGNYMPKCRQNYSVGFKLPWTLSDEEVWNKTHRFGGIVTVIGGVVILATSWLRIIWILLGVTLVLAFIPIIYSYCIYKKKHCKMDS